MKFGDLEKMPLDQLWRLHESIIAILDRKLVDETSKLQHKLDELGRKFGKTPSPISKGGAEVSESG